MLGSRRRRWPSIKITFDQCLALTQETLTQCWVNVGPALQTVGQHYPSTIDRFAWATYGFLFMRMRWKYTNISRMNWINMTCGSRRSWPRALCSGTIRIRWTNSARASNCTDIRLIIDPFEVDWTVTFFHVHGFLIILYNIIGIGLTAVSNDTSTLANSNAHMYYVCRV